MNDQSSIEYAFIRKLTEIIHANLGNENFGVKELARETGMSRFNLNRKLHSISRKTINQFIREVRLERAMELLRQEPFTASEVAFKVGFSSPAYFSSCFSEYFGYPPGEVKKRNLNGSGERKEVPSSEISDTKQPFIQARETPSSWEKQIWWAVSVAALIILAVVILTFYFNPETFGKFIFFAQNHAGNQEKSIAVLPFFNDSPNDTNVYIINQVAEAIRNNLTAIKDLRVVSRNSTEKYMNNKLKSTPEITRELGVSYIVEGSAQTIGNQIKITVQLIDGKTDIHFFSQSYERDLEDIFALESDIAMSVASKIKAVITPEEIEIIERKPTKNIAALSMYLQGVEREKIGKSERNNDLLQKAEDLFKRAIQLDSTYADPYIALGWRTALKSNNLDSAIYLANRALHFDPNNPSALGLKGYILMAKGLSKDAEELFKQAIKYNPNSYLGYHFLGLIYAYKSDYALSVEYWLKALKLEKDSKNYDYNTLMVLCQYLYFYGYYEDGLKFAEILIECNNDSLWYYQGLLCIDLKQHNYPSAYMNSLKSVQVNKGQNVWVDPFYVKFYMKDYKSAVRHFEEKCEDYRKRGLKMYFDFCFGYAYLKNGQKEKADYQFKMAIKANQDALKTREQNRTNTCIANIDLLGIYSAMGDKEKATEILRKVVKCNDVLFFPTDLYQLKNNIVFDIIRNEPEFQELIRNTEARLQPEMNKVEKLLKDYWSEN